MIEIRLREILKQRGISIRAFADKLGVGPNSLPISVAFSPSLTSLQRYAEALNIPAIELVRVPDVPTPVDDGLDHRDTDALDVVVARRIMDEMRQQKLTQKQVAERMGVSVQSFSQTIKKNKMSTATLDKIATALGVEGWQLMVTEAVNSEQLTINNESLAIAHADLECEELRHSQTDVNGMGTEPDLFTQIEEVKQVEADGAKVLTDGVYTYGGKRLVMRGGEIVIR